jgi:hypothetical protein
LVEGVEDAEAQRLPEVAMAEFVGGSQDHRATAAVTRVLQSSSGRRVVRERAWTRSV